MSVSDSDADELSDEAERIIGTSSTNPDSDGDGVSDGAEVRNGTNPLDGLPATIGVIGGVDTPGVAIDVVAREGLAATAEGTGGVILFDASNPFQPTRIAAIDTPGTAMAVALEMPHLVVADGASGLAVIDVSDAPAAKIVRQVRLGAAARGVALGAGIAYVALENGQVVGVDVLTGAVLGRAQVANKRIDDVVLAGDYLYATAAGVVAVLNPRDGFPLMVRSVITSGSSSDRLRLSAGLDRLYETISSGAVILDITNPAQMSVLQTRTFAQLGWRQLVSANRSIGLAAAGAASPDDLQLYSLGTNGTDLTFSTSLATPGVTSAVSSYNGLAYLADGSAGLMVANYLAADIGTMKPTITFTASFPTDSTTASVEEGKRVRVTADARDDVQVRNVELLINGEITQSDGSFPYEFRFLTPRLSAGKTSFILQLRAYDTGGNATITDPLPITLTPDSTAPFLVRSAPDDGDIVGAISGTTLVFNEPLDPATVSWASVRLRATGPNHLFDDADDVVPSGVEVSYRVDSNTIVVATSAAFPPGVYRVDISNAVTDLAGNHLTDPLRRVFHVLDFADRDSDGVPDEVEALLGLDPDNNDTDGDGISDGREDFDLDGLSNAAEAALGTNPQAADTNGNGISDANEDPDQDGLNNKFEIARGTDPANPDTDGDGWNDETEVTGGSDPLSPASRPKLSFVASPEVLIAVPSTAGVMNAPLAAGVVIAAPPVMVALSSTAEVGIVPVVAGGFVAAPPLAISLPSTSDISDGAPANGTYVAAPPVAVALPVSSEVASVPPGTGTHVALPPVNIHLPTP